MINTTFQGIATRFFGTEDADQIPAITDTRAKSLGFWTLLADRHQDRLHRACLGGEQTGKLTGQRHFGVRRLGAAWDFSER